MAAPKGTYLFLFWTILGISVVVVAQETEGTIGTTGVLTEGTEPPGTTTILTEGTQPPETTTLTEGTEPPTTEIVPFRCPSDFGNFADPLDCTGFYECSHGIPYHFSCPFPLKFNPQSEVCDHPGSVDCGSRPMP